MATTEARIRTSSFGIDEFREVFRHHPGAVSVITLADGEGRQVGFTATSVISISAEPAVIGFSIMHASSCWPALSQAKSVIVHFLDAQDVQISKTFATSGIDRFESVQWATLPTGEPVLRSKGTWVRAEILGTIAAGSSEFVYAAPTDASINDQRKPLVYHERAFHTLGQSSALDR